jgi:hypothetical protein
MIRTFKAAWDLFDNKFAYINFIILNFWLLTDSVFGPHTVSDEVYEVAAKPGWKLPWKVSMVWNANSGIEAYL